MFSNVTIGILFGLGIAAWVYNKVQRHSGGNTKNALIVGGLVGVLAFVLVVLTIGIFL
jgi:hypothetical protein